MAGNTRAARASNFFMLYLFCQLAIAASCDPEWQECDGDEIMEAMSAGKKGVALFQAGRRAFGANLECNPELQECDTDGIDAAEMEAAGFGRAFIQAKKAKRKEAIAHQIGQQLHSYNKGVTQLKQNMEALAKAHGSQEVTHRRTVTTFHHKYGATEP
eukprot:CAMPEP_0172658110 /NCGR_PEP_ID=MMETSP1074-20121228/2563_1 /TAXON_ID=2916 /ORGANISM="Ceratium fusus, Strain PA161109" /LENGTH=157 /DNA_ID=CAMNT_0013473349 /DNA_START=70 /DNA_END=543 /DNA_ORIENTATION=+